MLSFISSHCRKIPLSPAPILTHSQVSQHRLLAFTKRLATLALHQDHPTALAFLASLRKLLLLTPKTELLYENEGLGSGVYLYEMEDPEYCKPEASALWDLHLLKNHYHPTVASVATRILQHHPLQSEHKLTPEISLKDPVDLFQLYSTIQEKEVAGVWLGVGFFRLSRYS